MLRWAVEGYTQYALHGLGTPPEACRIAAQRMRADLSLVDAWLDECTDRGDPAATETVADLAESWHSWCQTNRVPEREQISTPALGKALTARGYTVDFEGPRAGRHRVRKGLRLLPQTDSKGNPSGTLRAVQ